VTAMLRPGKRPSGQEIRGFVRRMVGAIRALWPKVDILLRGDSHYAGPQVFDWCRANRVDLRPGSQRSVLPPCRGAGKETAERFTGAATHGKRRRFTQFYDAAQSWSRVERIITRVDAGPEGTDTRFIVTNLLGRCRPRPCGSALLQAEAQRWSLSPSATNVGGLQ